MQRISLSIEEWIALREGGLDAPPIWLTVVGGSMRPLIRPDRDQVMLVSVEPEEIKVGDIVLFPGHYKTARYCLHRVCGLDGDKVQTFGDALLRADGWMPRTRILGRAKLIKRGGKTIDCDDPGERKRAARWCALWRIRPVLLLPRRVADKLKRAGKSFKAHG